MPVLRQVVGEALRGVRLRQRRTLREVAGDAAISLGYLSEVERGQKEPSSELLAAICSALDVELSELFAEVTHTLRREERLALTGRVKLVGASPAPELAPALAAADGSLSAQAAQRHALAPVTALPTAAA